MTQSKRRRLPGSAKVAAVRVPLAVAGLTASVSVASYAVVTSGNSGPFTVAVTVADAFFVILAAVSVLRLRRQHRRQQRQQRQQRHLRRQQQRHLRRQERKAILELMLSLSVWFRFRNKLRSFAASGLTALAVMLAGRRGITLGAEWSAHLAGESGQDPVTWRKVRQALGFVAAAIQLRLQDAAELAWRPIDAVLDSRTLSNLFVGGPVIVVLFAIVRHDGRFGLVTDIQDAGELGVFLYGVIRLGRWWRQIKPPPPKPRRAQETDSSADQGRPSPE